MIGIRSKADTFNKNDDKFYLFKGEQFISVWRGTTHAGSDLLNPTNPKGVAVVGADYIFYDSHRRGKHKQKVWAYVQDKPLPIHRDNDRDRKAEEIGKPVWEIVGINIHPETYVDGSKVMRETIDGWSIGCQCAARRTDHDNFMKKTEGQKYLTYALLNEF